jgi:2-phosphosulfolactate phosphatase
MRIELSFTPHQADEVALRDKTVVAIDVLRASTTIITALHNGAREVIPVTTVESAVKLSAQLAGDIVLLGGERGGRMIQGFSLGNSPAEYTAQKVKGKSIVFSSTNGSRVLVNGRYAREMAVCGFVNMTMVVNYLRERPRDFILACAGTNGAFSLEDSVCAGMVVHNLLKDESLAVTLSDGALAAETLYRSHGKNVLKLLGSTQHGRYLQEIGFEDDLKLCAAVDSIPALPQLDGNVIRLKREAERKDVSPAASSS